MTTAEGQSIANPSRRKAPRSRLGCDTCRARKVKCDERPSRCGNCERLGLSCSGPRLSSVVRHSPHTPISVNRVRSTSPTPQTGVKRKRTYRSCTECRSSKTKCCGSKPICSRCVQKELPCVYQPEPEPAWAQRMAERHNEARPDLTETTRQSDSFPTGRHNSTTHEDGPLSWLTASELPGREEIRLLINQYFANIHPLRCFAFIHKPTFLRELENGSITDQSRSALLHVICALGAHFYCVSQTSHHLSPKFVLSAGKAWAKKAQSIVLNGIDDISIEKLMATVLLHDHAVRMGNFPGAFMLCGVAARMSQALQINLEYSTDILCETTEEGPSASEKESRRRLIWSCYIMDALVGSGVDQLTMIDGRAIKTQLPCSERNFLQQIACITETLKPGKVLDFIPTQQIPTCAHDNMGIAAHYIRHVEIRKRVLKYIKHLDQAKLPWLPDSEFHQLDGDCRKWLETLPASLQWTDTAIYIRKEASQLGALCALHCAYHQTMCDLYRLGAPALYKLRAAFRFPPEQSHFLKHLQWTLFGHAKSLASIMAETASHNVNMLADSWLPTILYDSCRIMLYHLTQLMDPAAESAKALMLETAPYLRQTVRLLNTMRSFYAVAEPLHATAQSMLSKAGLGVDSGSVPPRRDIIPDDPYSTDNMEEEHTTAEQTSGPETPPQSAPDYVLNPLSIYRLARRAIPEKHAPERAAGTSSNRSTSVVAPSDSQTSPLPTPQLQMPDGVTALNSFENDASLDEVRDFFTSDLGWTWQPAETAVGSGTVVANGMLPWAADLTRATGMSGMSGQQNLDAWEPPDFPFHQ